ncbi:hypothetical protein [Kribbella speibonae]|uniref:ABC transporter permease n=1 Tax=Kribbella speibonae TaxID=1572660 RepID=A0ABY2AFK6_9ACTN|nr:hypothetical protein [Kribbella speibonae]TCC27340.1 hypothetical protein E0H58_04995 [Kribbella speibonae]
MSLVETPGPILLIRTIRAEFARLCTLRSMWVMALLTTIAVVGISMLSAANASAELGQPVWMSIRRLGMLAMAVLLSMATAAATADHGTGGIVPTLQWTPRRPFLLTGRAIVIVVAVTATGLIPAFVGGMLAIGLAPELSWSWGQATEALAALGFVFALGALLAVGVGLLLRSTAASICAVFALVLVLPLLMGNLPFDWTKDVAALLPGTSMRQLLIGEGLPGLTDTGAKSTLAAWALGAFVVGGWRLVRGDANG